MLSFGFWNKQKNIVARFCFSHNLSGSRFGVGKPKGKKKVAQTFSNLAQKQKTFQGNPEHRWTEDQGPRMPRFYHLPPQTMRTNM